MDINKIFTYILVILTGMIMATFAAYYLLNEFVYPHRQANTILEVPVEQREDVQVDVEQPSEERIAPTEETTAPITTATTFTGTLEAVNTGCFADGECSVSVDGKHVTVLIGWSQDTVGSVIGVEGFGDLEAYLGKLVEVSAQDLGDNQYTLYGSEAFYIKVLP
jgi:hypothetical protein